MYIIVSLDAVLTVLAVMAFLGIGWAAMILTWVWEHAVLLGGILLVLHIFVNIGHTMEAMQNYFLLGLICSILHAVAQPMLVIKAYSVSAGSPFSFDLFVFWFSIFAALLISDKFWYKAYEARNGLYVPELFLNTFVSVGICAFLIQMINTNM